MNALKKIWMGVRHFRALRMAAASAVRLAEGDDVASALGGLTDEERETIPAYEALQFHR